MAGVFTVSDMVNCVHGGIVKPGSSTKLTVLSNAVLVALDLVGKSVSPSCALVTNVNTGMKQCTTVGPIANTLATKLTAGGVPVLLDPLQGATDGNDTANPNGPGVYYLTGTVVQAKLTAI
jgi:hypothetical protein